MQMFQHSALHRFRCPHYPSISHVCKSLPPLSRQESFYLNLTAALTTPLAAFEADDGVDTMFLLFSSEYILHDK